MATFTELTQEQQDVYNAFERNLRAAMGSFQRVCNSLEALNDQYNAQITTILLALDTDEIPPNTSGLSGSQALKSDSEMVTLVSHLQGITTNYNTSAYRQMRVKAAGLNAGVE